MRAVESMRIFTLLSCFRIKHIKFSTKSIEELCPMTLRWWCKDWGKTDTWLQKWLWWVLMQALATLKTCTLMCFFCQYVWFKKSTGELRHNTEEWCKVWRRIDLHSNNDIGSLANFVPTLKSLKIFILMGFRWSKSIIFELIKCRGDHLTGLHTEDWCKLGRKNEVWLHWWHEEFGEPHWSTQKS